MTLLGDLPDLSVAAREAARSPVPGFTPVGYVRSRYADPASTPIQSTRNAAEIARVELFAGFAGCTEGLEGFDYAWLITWLGRADAPAKDGRVVPFMLSHRPRRVGIFATRHPARPNPIGLSVVRVVSVDESGLTFAGVDLCHGTVVLDIKPWEQHLDVPGYGRGWESLRGIRGGWYSATGTAGGDQLLPDG